MNRHELHHWLRLASTPSVGNVAARQLLAAFGLPEAVFQQSAAALRQVVSRAQALALTQTPPDLEARVERTWQWLQEEGADAPSRHVLVWGAPDYPHHLLDIDEPPMLLYLMGPHRPGQHPAPLRWTPSIAIVGSRNPTPQGALNAHAFARALAQAHLCVVSGLALGVDAAAHAGALEGFAEPGAVARLSTVAVVGTGLDRIYPQKHAELARRIAQSGCLVSEYPLGTPPLAANFPKRNRLIAGLAQATLVVEATLQSGSLITARLSGDQGKDVFAIPGSIHAPQSRGCHALIKQGAKLVEAAQDVLEEFEQAGLLQARQTAPQAIQATATQSNQEDASLGRANADPVVEALGFDPVSLDALQQRTGLPTPQLMAQLTALELEGAVARLPGGLFQRLAQPNTPLD